VLGPFTLAQSIAFVLITAGMALMLSRRAVH